jgi:hypothetical protein
MPTITASPGLVYTATNAITEINSTGLASIDTRTKLWYFNYDGNSSFGVQQNNSVANVYFKNSLGTTLLTMGMSAFTRTMATNGYAVLTNPTAYTPSVAGTIAYIEIDHDSANYNYAYPTAGDATMANIYKITLTVGAIGSGADVEIDNRDLTTTQPWRLDGSIRFRVPNTFTYSL